MHLCIHPLYMYIQPYTLEYTPNASIYTLYTPYIRPKYTTTWCTGTGTSSYPKLWSMQQQVRLMGYYDRSYSSIYIIMANIIDGLIITLYHYISHCIFLNGLLTQGCGQLQTTVKTMEDFRVLNFGWAVDAFQVNRLLSGPTL